MVRIQILFMICVLAGMSPLCGEANAQWGDIAHEKEEKEEVIKPEPKEEVTEEAVWGDIVGEPMVEVEGMPKEDALPEEAEAGVEEEEQPFLTKEEMITLIKDLLSIYEEIEGLIPGLKVTRSESGEILFLHYSSATTGVQRIEDLDEDTLLIIMSQIQQHATRIQAERIHRQLTFMNQVQRMINLERSFQQMKHQAQQPHQPPRIPQPPPRPYQPPQPPKTPQPPPSPPVIPSTRR